MNTSVINAELREFFEDGSAYLRLHALFRKTLDYGIKREAEQLVDKMLARERVIREELALLAYEAEAQAVTVGGEGGAA